MAFSGVQAAIWAKLQMPSALRRAWFCGPMPLMISRSSISAVWASKAPAGRIEREDWIGQAKALIAARKG